jgi:hypothetical protein
MASCVHAWERSLPMSEQDWLVMTPVVMEWVKSESRLV